MAKSTTTTTTTAAFSNNKKNNMSVKQQQQQEQQGEHNPYQVPLTGRFLLLSFLSASLTCFALGSVARRILLLQQAGMMETPLSSSTTTSSLSSKEHSMGLPPLFVAPHKTFPHTRYTSKHYDTGLSVSSNTLLSHRQKTESDTTSASTATAATTNTSNTESDLKNNDNATTNNDNNTTTVVEEVHEPAGQHLLIDIEHVDGAFLNSEHHLAQAMVDLVEMSGLTMLSYHCHKLLPAGISCAGVLLESHVSFHTWPVQGVITLDLFTCGPNSLLNLLDDVNTLFAIPDSTTNNNDNKEKKQPNTVWAWKRRGFPTDEGYTPGISDLGTTLLGVLQFPQKEQVSFVQTPFQTVHIYNVLDPRYSNTKKEKRMYLDGVLQSRERGQAANAEALVHPALLTHANPQTVTIIGGGDGASLREVLKHASVEQVEWAEIDKQVVEISQQWLWSQCHDFLFHHGSSNSCRDDPRVNLYYEDGFQWFKKRYGAAAAEQEDKTSQPEEKQQESPATTALAPLQDVIILDVLNPEDDVDFSEVFFDDLSFAQVLFDALQADGILAVPLGPGRSLNDPPEQWTRARHVAKLVANLEQVGFAAIHEYEDSHTGKLEIDTNSFLVAFKNAASRQEWFANEAQVEIKLQQRLLRNTKTGELPLKYFDGAIMQSYQMPSRASEVMFCRNHEDVDCRQGLLLGDSAAAATATERDTEVETCVQELDVSEAAAFLSSSKKNKRMTVSQQVNPTAAASSRTMKDVYNPFRVRNAFTRACVSKSTINDDGVEITTTTVGHSTAADGEEQANNGNRPNHTNGECVAGEGECSASEPQAAMYETVSA